MIEQRPSPAVIRSAAQVNLKGIMTLHANASSPAMSQQLIDLGRVLGVRRAAQPKPMGKQSHPVIPILLALDALLLAKPVAAPLFAVRIVQVPPIPRRQRLVFIGGNIP